MIRGLFGGVSPCGPLRRSTETFGIGLMIDDFKVQEALDFLVDSAEEMGRVRGLRVYLEESRKSVKADMASRSAAKTQAQKENDAYASEEYKKHLDKLREAVIEDETLRARRAAYLATIDAWRTLEASRRGADRI